MTDTHPPKLIATIFKLYRSHWALFWRIMLPVAIIAIGWNVAQNLRLGTMLEEDLSNRSPSYPNGKVFIPVSSISTDYGIQPSIASSDTDLSTNRKYPYRSTLQLLPVPSFRVTNNRGLTWEWVLRFQSFYSLHLFPLLLTLCPLSLAVARISRLSQNDDNAAEVAPPNAREMWRQTGRKAFKVIGTFLIFMLIVDVGANLYALILWLIHLLNWDLSIDITWHPGIVFHIYLFVTLSLYNPCLILENNSIVGIFHRSHALVSGARWRFFGIYLLTGWAVSIIASVLFGAVLLVFSLFIPDLAPVREALLPVQFLTLFIGFNVQVELPKLLGDPTTVTILIVRDLINTAIIPIWAIVTTRLYLERAYREPNEIEA